MGGAMVIHPESLINKSASAFQSEVSMNIEQHEQFSQFLINYKSAYNIFLECQMNGVKYPLNLEIRKSGKCGCELFTTLNGTTYQLFSGNLGGCIHRFVQSLPQGSTIEIPHRVFVEVKDSLESLLIIEEISQSPNIHSDNSAIGNNPSLILRGRLGDQSIQTQVYESDDLFDALSEFESKLKQENVIIRVCANCHFYDQLLNKEVCLRDLPSDKISQIRGPRAKRLSPEIYFEKIAWDMDHFHFCSAFTKR